LVPFSVLTLDTPWLLPKIWNQDAQSVQDFFFSGRDGRPTLIRSQMSKLKEQFLTSATELNALLSQGEEKTAETAEALKQDIRKQAATLISFAKWAEIGRIWEGSGRC
jgi:hypothetical protein